MHSITLRTMSYARPQAVFDQMARHLLAQASRSVNPTTGLPAYRGEDGKKCPGGCLISDAEYTPLIEGSTWGELCIAGFVPEAHGFLVVDMREIHENVSPEQWRERLMDYAIQNRYLTTALT